MKKYLLILTAGAFSLASCSDKKESGGMSEKAKKNLESHRAIANMFETNDFSKIGDYIAVDAVDYSEGRPIKGLDSIKASFMKMDAMAGDMKNEPIKEMADDEYVMAWLRFTGTMNGTAFTSDAVEVSQYDKDSKVIAHWTFMQPADVMKMMGMDPGQTPPSTENKTDTTKK
jgi:SnoaL-like polyketide cyclase